MLGRLLRPLFSAARKLARRFGLDLKLTIAIDPSSSSSVLNDPVCAMLWGMSRQERIRIVVVGAGWTGPDDGSVGSSDPALAFITEFPDRVAGAILIEPIVERTHVLETLKLHVPDLQVLTRAVAAEEGHLSLWSPSPAVQAEIRRIESARGNPSSGGLGWSSTDREHVARMVRSLTGRSMVASRAALVERHVPAQTLGHILSDIGVTSIDYLQVDVEGFDDVVLLSNDFAVLAPALVCFESVHLSEVRLRRVVGHLEAYGYREIGPLSPLDTLMTRL